MAEEAPGREPTPWLSFGLLEFQGQIPDVKSRFWMTQSYVFLCTIDITQTLGKNHIESTDT